MSSFFSPCVLPMVPVYLASLYGPGIFEARNIRLPVFIHSLCFVLGFTVVFVLWGAIAGLTGFRIIPNYALLHQIAGSLMIAFGLFILASMKISWLNYEKHLAPNLGSKTGYIRSFLIGGIFSLGWTPCVVGYLGNILALAAIQETAGRGAFLLAVYSFGLGLPFLIVGAAFDFLLPVLKRINRYTGIIRVVSGLLLISVGILVLTGKLAWISSLGT